MYHKQLAEKIIVAQKNINFLKGKETFYTGSTFPAVEINGSVEKIKATLKESLKTLICNLNAQPQIEDVEELWSNDYLSARDFGLLSSYIVPETGAIKIENHLFPSDYKCFFNSERIHQELGYLENRGFSYYSNTNPIFNKEEKLQNIIKDIVECINILKQIGREERKQCYWFFLGILDYIKSHTITLLHSLIFEERSGLYNDSDQNYLFLKESLTKYTNFFIDRFYEYLLGFQFSETINYKEYVDIIYRSVDWIIKRNLNCFTIKQPELDNPLILLNASISICYHFQDIETIFGIPSGGTEFAFLTKFIFKKLNSNHKRIDVFLVSLSRYSKNRASSRKISSNALGECINKHERYINDKNILILDDNSNTGQTGLLLLNEIDKHQPKSMNYQVAEVDIYRGIVKHTKWENKPKTIAHPNVYTSAVNITPISYSNKNLQDFKQLRKLHRLNVIQKYYSKKILPLSNSFITNTTANVLGGNKMKVCSVHNTVDLKTCLNFGVQWIGVHLTYKQDSYQRKLIEQRDWLGFIKTHCAHEYFRNGNLPIPWAEYEGIRSMILDSANSKYDLHIVFLISPESENEVISLFDALLPKNYNKKLCIQIQSVYDEKLIKKIRLKLNKSNYTYTQIIQTIGLDTVNSEDIIHKINKNKNIDYVLLDSYQRGGTGKQASIIKLIENAKICNKPFFVAGGVSSENIKELAGALLTNKLFPLAFDVETSTELIEKVRCVIQPDEYIKIRKDQQKIKDLSRMIGEILT